MWSHYWADKEEVKDELNNDVNYEAIVLAHDEYKNLEFKLFMTLKDSDNFLSM